MLIQFEYKKAGLVLLAASTLVLAGCGGERKNASSANALKVNDPASIVNESAANYDDNVNGLITHKTLKKWINNWDQNKPKGIKGKLVIFQQAKGQAGEEFIKPNNTNVFTYVESGWLETRSNGVMNIPSIVLSGPSIDNLVRKYGIDLENDMIVCAQGDKAGATGSYMNQGRCWFALSYWGVDQKNIAVLNGNNQYLATELGASYFTSSTVDGKNPSPIIARQISSVKDLKVDNTALYASIEDVINVLPLVDAPDNTDNVLLWDARNLPQYSAGKFKWNGAAIEATDPQVKTTAVYQNYAARQSHPRGALNLEFTNLLDVATGVYHDKATLDKIVRGHLAPSGQGFVSGGVNEDYQYVGVGNAYQNGDTIIHYCETSLRAGITIIAAGVVLGIPSRLYDSAMIEWNSLTSGVNDKNGEVILPQGSIWDTEYLSAPVGAYGDPAVGVNPRSAAGYAVASATGETAEDILEGLTKSPLIVDAFAEHADEVVKADRAYKAPVVVAPEQNNGGSGSGSSGPNLSNPCGG